MLIIGSCVFFRFFVHSFLKANSGSSSLILTNLASPPMTFSKVVYNDLTSMVPSCVVNLFLFPGLRITILFSFPASNNLLQAVSIEVSSHINLYLAPLSIFLS